jgi:hypothetical protein
MMNFEVARLADEQEPRRPLAQLGGAQRGADHRAMQVRIEVAEARTTAGLLGVAGIVVGFLGLGDSGRAEHVGGTGGGEFERRLEHRR